MEKLKSPETGTIYTSEYPITEQVKKNTLFAEKVKSLDDLKRFSDIPRILIDVGPEKLAEFEKMLNAAGKQLSDLMNLQRKPAMLQSEAEQNISRFFETEFPAEKESLIQEILPLLS